MSAASLIESGGLGFGFREPLVTECVTGGLRHRVETKRLHKKLGWTTARMCRPVTSLNSWSYVEQQTSETEADARDAHRQMVARIGEPF